jgi:hypothetical protein
MSDENVIGPGFWDEATDAEAPTQRDPQALEDPRLVPGVALSVLWWADEEVDDAPAPPAG